MWYQIKENNQIIFASQNSLEVNNYLESNFKIVIGMNYDKENNFLYVEVV